LKREVTKLRNVVVGEVYRVVVLQGPSAACRKAVVLGRLTLAAPMFSMAEILWPKCRILISTQLSSVVSVLFNVPRRSSSRSVRQLMKERELLIRSVVNLMLAMRSATFRL
jgi:hypothetical protein